MMFGLPLIGDTGVWYAFTNSDAMGKAVVLLLFMGSMVAWFIMIEKGLGLYRAQKLSERFAAQFSSRHGLSSMLRDATGNPSPVAHVYMSGMEQLLEFYGQNPEEARRGTAGTPVQKLSPAQLDAVQTALEREVSRQIFVIEEHIGVLGTAVSLSPFLGLFGTVWGVMIAFCGAAAAGSANIQALAPGVAGALLTTVAGLLVAIPSLVGYNTLTQMIRKITVSMDNFSETFMARLKLEQLESRDQVEPAAPPVPMTAAQRPANMPPQDYRAASAASASPHSGMAQPSLHGIDSSVRATVPDDVRTN